MSTEIAVLRALLRLSRRRVSATLDDLLDRVGCDAPELHRALASLAHSQLVQRSGSHARLSLAGLAVACAAAANARRAKTVARPSRGTTARIVPIERVRRGRRAA